MDAIELLEGFNEYLNEPAINNIEPIIGVMLNETEGFIMYSNADIFMLDVVTPITSECIASNDNNLDMSMLSELEAFNDMMEVQLEDNSIAVCAMIVNGITGTIFYNDGSLIILDKQAK